MKQSAERMRSVETMLEEEARRALARFETVRSSAGQKLSGSETELQKVMGRAVAEGEKALEHSSLVARAESDQKAYDQILEKLNQVKVEMEIPHTSQVIVEDKAVPAEKPFRPDKPMSLVLADLLFGGLFLGVPVVSGNGNFQMLAEAFGPGAPREALYRLAFEVERAAGTLAHRCLLVTSAEEREGKSFLAAALGGVYSSQGKKTLVVDCNLRSPSLSYWFPHLATGTATIEPESCGRRIAVRRVFVWRGTGQALGCRGVAFPFVPDCLPAEVRGVPRGGRLVERVPSGRVERPLESGWRAGDRHP